MTDQKIKDWTFRLQIGTFVIIIMFVASSVWTVAKYKATFDSALKDISSTFKSEIQDISNRVEKVEIGQTHIINELNAQDAKIVSIENTVSIYVKETSESLASIKSDIRVMATILKMPGVIVEDEKKSS